jgi:hypothetical protein
MRGGLSRHRRPDGGSDARFTLDGVPPNGPFSKYAVSGAGGRLTCVADDKGDTLPNLSHTG